MSSLRYALGLPKGGGGGFSPALLPNLLAWYDAPSLAQSDASAITSWADRSGNGRTLTQGTGAAQPTYKTAIKNGLGVARFDGGDSITLASVDLSAQTALTVFAVIKVDDFTALRSICSFGVFGTTVGSFELRTIITTGVLSAGGFRANFALYSGPALVAGTWYVVAGRVDLALASGEPRAWVNGDDTGSVTAEFNNSGAFASSAAITVGGRGGGTNLFKGDIGEVLFYGGSLSATNRGNVESLLRARWGI